MTYSPEHPVCVGLVTRRYPCRRGGRSQTNRSVPLFTPRYALCLSAILPSSLFSAALQFPSPLPLPAATNHSQPERKERHLKKKTRGAENGKRGKDISRALSFFLATKDQWASISGLSVDTGLEKEQPAGWINRDEKW